MGTNCENFAVVLTGAARHITLADRTLKEFYLFLHRVTWSAHLPGSSAERVRTYSKNMQAVVAKVIAAIIKIKFRYKDFRDAGFPSTPMPVVMRWANWLKAVCTRLQ